VEIVTTTYTFAFSILADVATVGAERISEKIGKASLRDAAIGTGIAVDKMLALTGETPAIQIANLILPLGSRARGASVGAHSSGRYRAQTCRARIAR